MHLCESIEHTLLRLLAARAGDASICPSEVARTLDGDSETWRGLMPSIRIVAARLAQSEVIEVTQRGHAVDIAQAHGPVRLKRGKGFDEAYAEGLAVIAGR
nr:DUF3253 domain-containing protein [Pseudoxanthomonas sp. GM95]